MENRFPDEVSHLAAVKSALAAALRDLDVSVSRYEDEYITSKQYLASYWNELDAMERFSNQCSIDRTQDAGNHTLAARDRIHKLLHAPYFAHIDFRFDGEQAEEPIYIGPFGFADDGDRTLVYDWRAPIANMYYEFETGPASYRAPTGEFVGELVRKRQIKIRAGELEYVLESAMNIDDDILRRELSATSDEKMKTIIATIQAEQNRIVRNNSAHTLIIQGVAGSGKTSIALHRIAYLLYRHRERLSARNVAIISPNKVFADYISGVLPELGEEPIVETGFEDIAEEELGGTLSFESPTAHIEDESAHWAEKQKLKSSPDLSARIDRYLAEVDARNFAPQDLVFGGFLAKGNRIADRYRAHSRLPLFARLSTVAGDILGQMQLSALSEERKPTKGEVAKKLRGLCRCKTTLELYRDFYRWAGRPELFETAGPNRLEWPDVFPYLYMKLRAEGARPQQSIQHLVIDEMQDYTPIQYAVIALLYRCKKTILGDAGQAISPDATCGADALGAVFDGAQVVELTKSYRSTCEIIEFVRRIKSGQTIETVERHGPPPALIRCGNPTQELDTIKGILSTFLAGPHSSLGILCKTTEQAERLYRALSGDHPVQYLDFDCTRFKGGIHVTTIPVSKGLEFDEVIVPFADPASYRTDRDRNLLYVACTRAMHKLALTFQGTPTGLIGR